MTLMWTAQVQVSICTGMRLPSCTRNRHVGGKQSMYIFMGLLGMRLLGPVCAYCLSFWFFIRTKSSRSWKYVRGGTTTSTRLKALISSSSGSTRSSLGAYFSLSRSSSPVTSSSVILDPREAEYQMKQFLLQGIQPLAWPIDFLLNTCVVRWM